MRNIDKRAQKELYAKVEKQAHSLRGNPCEYQVVTGLCPVNVIEMHAHKILALLDELEAKDSTIAEQSDYFSALVAAARKSADKAMRKYPQPNYVLLKVAEEAGEVVQAGVHYAENRMTWDEVEGEIVQLLAMLIRLVTEGDQINGVTPPQSVRAAGIVVKGE